jgi:Tol biopolymer transport system component
VVPDGSRLVFGCTLGRILPSRVGDFELCVVGADGRGLRRLTDAPGISAAGGWSADGRRIVFTSSRDQDPTGVSPCGDLFLVDADGAHLTKLTDGQHGTATRRSPRTAVTSWSPPTEPIPAATATCT